jgi:hypothetical protein
MTAKLGEPVIYRPSNLVTQVGFVESIVSGDTVMVVAWDPTQNAWQNAVMAARGEGIGDWIPIGVSDSIQAKLDDAVSLAVVNQAIQDAIDPDGHIDQAITAAIAAACAPGGAIDIAIQAAVNP